MTTKSNINKILKKHIPLLNIFSAEYKEETAYRECMKRNVEKFKLKEQAESIDDMIKRIADG